MSFDAGVPQLAAVAEPVRPSVAEEAKTVVVSAITATLASVGADGPWASPVDFGVAAGRPVVRTFGRDEHVTNLMRDPSASVSIVAAGAQVTLVGLLEEPVDVAAARAAVLAVEGEEMVEEDLWEMDVLGLRWVGGDGRTGTASGREFLAARPDPIVPVAGREVGRLNAEQSGALLALARVLGGCPEAVSAMCVRADRYGLDLAVGLVRGRTFTRVGFARQLDGIDELWPAMEELARRADAAEDGVHAS
ncbi:pyridoxamine 5'-phosphate oxidase [Nocardia panacis]|uniref:Pyridoxamine 5'-phosphate oxidase n=1 Tax=Nocardia panacis TaxID=2340916 RepID=A0A3A4KVW5_9NOCA|nr:pyridoxamine 5'-phosphate oxidase family protein [Nocardia panacis]RJO74081.1 pyridoxamine 5'-phosphate oxidase [Nocardia panacis]